MFVIKLEISQSVRLNHMQPNIHISDLRFAT